MDKVEYALNLLKETFVDQDRIGVVCSFGKDSVTAVHLARRVVPTIPVFSIMTVFKPKETFAYLVKINKLLDLNVQVYMVAETIPQIFKDNHIKVELLSPDVFRNTQDGYNRPLHLENAEKCCHLLKVVPIEHAIKNYDLLVDGLRSSEGNTSKYLPEVEKNSDLTKLHPILHFTEDDIFKYLSDNSIPIHSWYGKKISNGKKYRSLGCAPCTRPIFDHESERDGRWQGSNKKGGECGIHATQIKPSTQKTPILASHILKSNKDKKIE